MNKVLNILTLSMLVFFMSCAISKKENERMEKLLSKQSEVAPKPIADQLTSDMLRNFEERAIQKLEDLYDYIELLSNENYEELMKEEIRVSAQGLFFDLNVKIQPLAKSNDNMLSVDDWLIFHEQKPDRESCTLKDLKISEPLSKISKNEYDGLMSFDLYLGLDENQKIIPKEAPFTLRKIEKNIGNETVWTWEVFLMSIN